MNRSTPGRRRGSRRRSATARCRRSRSSRHACAGSRRSTRAINAVVRLGRRRARGGPPRRRGARAPARPAGPLHGVPFTIKDSLDTAGVVTTAGHGRLARPRPGARRDRRGASAGRRRDPAGQDQHAGVHLVQRDRQRRLRPDVEPVRPRAHAGRQQRRAGGDRRRRRLAVRHRQRHGRQHPPAGARLRRRGAQADQRPGPADRVTGPAFTGILESLTQLGPIARRVEDLALVLPLIAGPDGEDPHVAPVALGDPRGGRRPTGCASSWFTDNGIRTPTPETDRRGRGGGRRAAPMPGADGRGAACRRTWPTRPTRGSSLIRADGHAWLWRLISTAGTAGHGLVRHARLGDRHGRRCPVTRCRRSSSAPTTIRSRACCAGSRDVDLIVCPVMPQPAIRHGDSISPLVRRHVQRRAQPHRVAGRQSSAAGPRPRVCRSASSSSPRRGARTSRWRRRRRRGGVGRLAGHRRSDERVAVDGPARHRRPRAGGRWLGRSRTAVPGRAPETGPRARGRASRVSTRPASPAASVGCVRGLPVTLDVARVDQRGLRDPEVWPHAAVSGRCGDSHAPR